MPVAHSSQILDGTDITFLVGSLTLPSRPTATLASGVLTKTCEPTTMLSVTGSTTASLTIGKNNQAFRLFNDDGWEQGKILSRRFEVQLTSYFVKDVSTTTPDLDDAFAILEAAALADEEEIYVKFRKYLGTTTGGSPKKVYSTRAGTVKVTDFSEQMPAPRADRVVLDFDGTRSTLRRERRSRLMDLLCSADQKVVCLNSRIKKGTLHVGLFGVAPGISQSEIELVDSANNQKISILLPDDYLNRLVWGFTSNTQLDIVQ